MAEYVRLHVRMEVPEDGTPILVCREVLTPATIAALRRWVDSGNRPPLARWCPITFSTEFCDDSLAWLAQNQGIKDRWLVVAPNLDEPSPPTEAAGKAVLARRAVERPGQGPYSLRLSEAQGALHGEFNPPGYLMPADDQAAERWAEQIAYGLGAAWRVTLLKDGQPRPFPMRTDRIDLPQSGPLLFGVDRATGPDMTAARYLCRRCGKVTIHQHLHDTAHGIAETHMTGSERWTCADCNLSTFASDGIPGFEFAYDGKE